jgi:ATP-dependent Lhr-like helicase
VAIARRARAGLVEPARVHEGSLDVVANQVVALALCRDGVSAMAAYDLVTRAAPYHDLDRERFKELLRELSRNRVCYLDEDGDRVEPSGGTRGYVYQNLSMIPDEETYAVEDVARGGRVGSLDERFVVNFAEPGATFVQRGEIWRVVTVEDEESVVRVSPVEDPAGEVPSWTGQEIPVPPGVAGEVGELRRSAAPQLASGAEPAAVARDLARRYPAEPAAIEPAVDVLADHVREYPVPTDDRVVVEGGAGTVVVGAALGHRANEALGRMLSSLVGQRTGSSVGVDAGPYRVELDVPGGVSATDVAELLRETDPEHVRPIVELSLKRSDRLVFRLSTVARKFGALDGDGVGPRRLVAALEDTAAYEEAVRVLFHEEMDVAAASETLAAIQGGDLDLAVVGGHTPLGRSAGGGGTDLVAPENADADVVETVRERIQDDRVRLFCCNCADWERTTTVGRVDQPQCPDCEATRVAALHPAADEAVDAVRAVQAPQREADADQQKRARRAYRNASLVQTHGHRAVAALAARGVGPENAARIINNHREDELDFYRDVLEREREYARTKSFWD